MFCYVWMFQSPDPRRGRSRVTYVWLSVYAVSGRYIQALTKLLPKSSQMLRLLAPHRANAGLGPMADYVSFDKKTERFTVRSSSFKVRWPHPWMKAGRITEGRVFQYTCPHSTSLLTYLLA